MARGKTEAPERVTFSSGYAVCIMAIDGKWVGMIATQCQSPTTMPSHPGGLDPGPYNLRNFLLLSSTAWPIDVPNWCG